MATVVRTLDIAEEIKRLATRIRQNLCILFLGPGTLKTTAGIPLNNAFALSLAEELSDKISFDKNLKDNIAYMVQAYMYAKNEKLDRKSMKIADLRDKFRTFYQSVSIDYSLYNELASLPFTLVINTNYDNYFQEAYKKNHLANNRNVQAGMYDFSNNIEEAQPQDNIAKKPFSPQKNNFVVYNLFGICDDATLDSMILSEAEFVRYVGRIHQPRTGIPLEITNYIDENKYCLFLGFDFDQWYLKVVIRALWNGCHSDTLGEKQPDALALDQLPADPTVFFYQDAFKFYFVNKAVPEFITDLKAALSPAGPLPVSRKPEVPKEPLSIVFLFDTESAIDAGYRDMISKQLQQLKSEGYASLWSEDLALGEKERMVEQMRTADIVVALVSTDFIFTQRHIQYQQLIAANTNKHLKNVAVLVRPCMHERLEELKKFNWYPAGLDKENKRIALNQYAANEQEMQLTRIAEVINQHIYDAIK